jgi:hypothetical protein
MSRKRNYHKIGASPLYKVPTVPIKIFVTPVNAEPHFRTYYVAKYGEKLFKYSAKEATAIRKGLFSKYKTYLNEVKLLMKQKKIDKNNPLYEVFGSHTSKYLGFLFGVASGYKFSFYKEDREGNLTQLPFSNIVRKHKGKIQNLGDKAVWNEEIELINGHKIQSSLVYDKNSKRLVYTAKVIDNLGNVKEKKLVGVIENVNGKNLVIKDIKNYTADDLVGMTTFLQNKFDNIEVDKFTVFSLPSSQLFELKRSGFVNSDKHNFSWLQDHSDLLKEMKSEIKTLLEDENLSDVDKAYVKAFLNDIDRALKKSRKDEYFDITYVLPPSIDKVFLILNKSGLLNLSMPNKLEKIVRKYILKDLKNVNSSTYTLRWQGNIHSDMVSISEQDPKKKAIIQTGLSRIIAHSYYVQKDISNDAHLGYERRF